MSIKIGLIAGKVLMKKYSILLLVAAVCLLLADNAYAYLNLGSGSYIIQIAIAAVLGTLVTLKVFWSNVKEFFKGLFSTKKK